MVQSMEPRCQYFAGPPYRQIPVDLLKLQVLTHHLGITSAILLPHKVTTFTFEDKSLRTALSPPSDFMMRH